MTKAKELQVRIAKLAAEGFCPSLIAKRIFGSNKYREKVRYHIKKLEKEKILRPIRGTKNPKLYTKGDDFWKFINKHEPENGDHVGWFIAKAPAEAHHFFYKFNVISPASRPVPWSKAWAPNNKHADIEKLKRELCPDPAEYKSDIHRVWRMSPGDDFNKMVTIKEDIGRRSHTIMIMMHPEKLESAKDIEQIKKVMTDRAMQLADMLQRAFGYRLGLIEESDGHYAFEMEKETVKIAKKYNIRTQEIWFDESNGKHHLETKKARVAKAIVELPDTLEELKEMIEEQQKTILEIYDELHKTKEVAKAQAKFNAFLIKTIDALVQDGVIDAKVLQQYMQADAGADTKPDDRRDVV
ncbi:MAG TPA: hypothetical protein ENI53_00815 [Thermoplasmatales archaeon]|nr:hypothetical protein [Thermoplasmatales archaeon]